MVILEEDNKFNENKRIENGELRIRWERKDPRKLRTGENILKISIEQLKETQEEKEEQVKNPIYEIEEGLKNIRSGKAAGKNHI